MAETTGIAWTDATFNPWIGCTKVGPGCDHCYASVSTPARTLGVVWGAGQPRRRTKESNWRKPLAWNARPFVECVSCGWRGEQRDAPVVWDPPGFHPPVPKISTCQKCNGYTLMEARRRVFCASLADVFDNEVDTAWRADLFALIERTPNLDWLLLTKRIGNVGKWVHWGQQNVWLGATIVNQEEADRDIPKLLATPAAKHFLSLEPMLGPIDLSCWLKGERPQHDERRAIVSGANGDRSVFGGCGRDHLAASTAHSREPHRNTAILESGHEAIGGALEVGRLSDRHVLGREDAAQGIRTSGRLDGAQPSRHSAGHGSEPRERQARRHDAEQPDVDDPIAEHDSRHPGSRTEADNQARRTEPRGAAHGSASGGHPKTERQDRTVSTGDDVRGHAGHHIRHCDREDLAPLTWVIVGGESAQPGHPARPFDIAWARDTVRQCREAGVAVFVKQMGSALRVRNDSMEEWPDEDAFSDAIPEEYQPAYQGERVCIRLKDRAGADPAEWPSDLRVREFPA